VCEFGPEENFTSSIQVFINTDNTRAFVFGSDRAGSQTAMECQGATPKECLLPDSGKPPSCLEQRCPCKAVTKTPESLFSEPAREMAKSVGEKCSASGGVKILNIGLGGGALTSYLLDNCAEGTNIMSVEKDPRIISMAARFFGYKMELGTNEIDNDDASEALAAHALKGLSYGAILVDCFEANGDIPESCRDFRFVNGLYEVLNPSGLIVQHVWSAQYEELLAVYQEVFNPSQVDFKRVDAKKSVLLLASKVR